MENFEYNDINFESSQPKSVSNPPKAKFSFLTLFIAVLVSCAIAFSSSVLTTLFLRDYQKEETPIKRTSKNEIVNVTVEEQSVSIVQTIAEKVTPSVVGIRTTTAVNSFFGESQESQGEGSGVIYKRDGYIITNFHVIEDAVVSSNKSKIEVFLNSTADKSYEASVVGYNVAADLAVIKIDAKNLPVIEIADSDSAKVGQFVVTIGNPGGLEFMDSVTYGIISGLDRCVSSDGDIGLIQTDAAINPGNSGGALVDIDGKLVGINSSKIVSEEFEGMGFAIPSNETVEICNKIISNENSPEPYIGITLSEKYTAEVLEYYGYPAGAVVASVYDGSPAYRAGIRKGDIITKFGGTEISDYTVLQRLMAECQPKQKVNITIYRNNRYYTATITVGSNNSMG